jgi:hypothetical protein
VRLIRGRYGYRVRHTWVCGWGGQWRTEHSDRLMPVNRLGDGRRGNVLLRNWRYVTRGLTGYRAPRSGQ